MENDLARLKQILLGDDYEQLLALRDKLNDDRALTELIASVIAEALRERNRHDEAIADVLAPTIDQAIAGSIDQDPKKLAESLYPIMGPAIRKSISETLQQMLENFNHLLEDSFSPKALRWRFDAWRTGTPYSEFIMLQTLDYQVEQVFLIHKESSLLIQHHFSELVETQDPDMVSGMFSAIQDFIEDSFSTQEQDKLDTLRLGELSVLLTRGPAAVLATAVRGRVPENIRRDMTTTLEAISINKRKALEQYAGDPDVFSDVTEDLQALLQSQRKEPAPRKTPWKAIVLLLAALIGAGVWSFHQHQQAHTRSQLIDQISQEPGLIVLNHHYADKRLHLTLLADPYARTAAEVIAPNNAGIELAITQYSHLSALDSIVSLRAHDLLQPPASASMNVHNGILQLSGSVSDDWLHQFTQRWPAITAIKGINLDALTVVYPKQEAMAAAITTIESMELNFAKGQTQFEADDALISATAAQILRLNELAIASHGRPVRIDVIGYTDETGSDATNMRIGLARATNLQNALIANGVDGAMLHSYSSLAYPSTDNLSERKTRLVVHTD